MTSTGDVLATILELGDRDRLLRLHDAHAGRDGARLGTWMAGRLDPSASTAIVDLLGAEPTLLRGIPGCAGLHLSAEHPERDRMLSGLVVELAARAHRGLTVAVDACDSVALPISGCRVRSGLPPTPAICTAADDGSITVDWGDGGIQLGYKDDDLAVLSASERATLLRPEHILGVRVDSPGLFDLGFSAEKATVRGAADLRDDERAEILAGLRLLQLGDAAMLSELVAGGTCVTPLVTRADLLRQSFSVQALPGVVFCSTDDPFEMADVVCHEYHHLKLFLIEEEHPLLDNPIAPAIAPWRRDLRHARGVLHGTYVFFQVARVLGRLFETFPPSRSGLRKLMIWRTAVRFGLDSLYASDWQPTPVGAALAAEMDRVNGERLDELSAVDPELAEWTYVVIADHITQAGRPDSPEPWFLGL